MLSFPAKHYRQTLMPDRHTALANHFNVAASVTPGNNSTMPGAPFTGVPMFSEPAQVERSPVGSALAIYRAVAGLRSDHARTGELVGIDSFA